MRYITNPAGNRIVDATPEETRTLRPSIRACFRRWGANGGDIEDFCQDVEVIVWRAIAEQRIPGDGFKRPEDALLNYMFMVAWNIWRNHSKRQATRSEVFVIEMPEMPGPDPEPRLDARETLLRLTAREDIARVLLDSVNVPAKKRYEHVPKSTYGYQLTQARRWARDVDEGRWQKPRQPVTPTPWKRKKKR